jgi:hypothetical protein
MEKTVKKTSAIAMLAAGALAAFSLVRSRRDPWES